MKRIYSLRSPHILLILLLSGFVGSLETAPSTSPWKTLSPLPDPIGFSGMFAGLSEEGLFAGGGSQFVDGPAWRGGKKVFSNKIFLLPSLESSWEELPIGLPNPVTNGASAPYQDSVIIAGGLNTTGSLRQVWKVTVHDRKPMVEELPPLPHPLVYAAAAVVQDVFYVVGGIPGATSTDPSQECWALPLAPGPDTSQEWIRQPDLPGKAGMVMSASADDTHLYVFGGISFLPPDEGKSHAVPLDNAYRFNPQTKIWNSLTDLPWPRVGAASPAPRLPNGSIFLVGGYGFIFSGPAKDHPGFDRQSFLYSPTRNAWTDGPPLPRNRIVTPGRSTSPGPEPMLAAPAVLWKNLIIIISGEVRPSIRSPSVFAIPVSDLLKKNPDHSPSPSLSP